MRGPSFRALPSMLLLAVIACAPKTVMSAEPEVPASAGAPASSPSEGGGQQNSSRSSEAATALEQRMIEARKQAQAAQERLRAAQSRPGEASGGGGGRGGHPNSLPMGTLNVIEVNVEPPMILITQPVDASIRVEWTEDLKVMNKLVRDEIAQAVKLEAMALGIRVLTLNPVAAPMYIEGCGAVFSGAVSWPLAAGENTGATTETQRERMSAWARAKRELEGRNAPGDQAAPPPPEFDQAKLDQLIESLVTMLPEATNIRHLKKNEFVFVTVQGVDDAGKPKRLTMKASKSDIDDASAGTLAPEEFRKRVVFHIG